MSENVITNLSQDTAKAPSSQLADVISCIKGLPRTSIIALYFWTHAEHLAAFQDIEERRTVLSLCEDKYPGETFMKLWAMYMLGRELGIRDERARRRAAKTRSHEAAQMDGGTHDKVF